MFIDLFPVRIYKNKIENINSVCKEVIPTLETMWREKDNSHVTLGVDTVSTYRVKYGNALHELPEFKIIVDQLTIMINNYWKELNFFDGLTPCITEMWANFNKANSAISSHSHAPYHMNGVLYLNKESTHGNIVFENPSSTIVSLQPLNYESKNQVQFGVEKEIEVNTGDVLIFPGWLKHYTRPTTEDGRIVIAFNVGCTGHYPISSYVTNN